MNPRPIYSTIHSMLYVSMRGQASVFMLSPQKKMSPFQAAQMFSLKDRNSFNVAIAFIARCAGLPASAPTHYQVVLEEGA
jgi:hypothetical protein